MIWTHRRVFCESAAWFIIDIEKANLIFNTAADSKAKINEIKNVMNPKEYIIYFNNEVNEQWPSSLLIE